ncbi:MAG: FCD domain-containing protein, partial [Pyrinomonadaceae bacterium]
DLKVAAERHRPVYRAIRARAPGGARAAMREHLDRAQRAWELEKQDAADDSPADGSDGNGAGGAH